MPCVNGTIEITLEQIKLRFCDKFAMSKMLHIHIMCVMTLNLQMLQMMENSNLTSLKRGWQGNTIPMAWSTFWVHPSEQILRKLNRSV